jgi:hypothetical protein
MEIVPAQGELITLSFRHHPQSEREKKYITK